MACRPARTIVCNYCDVCLQHKNACTGRRRPGSGSRLFLCSSFYCHANNRTIMLKTQKITSDNRLIDAVLEQWEVYGYEGVSARQLSTIASVPPSSIYHHFGSLEQLLVLAQEHAQALTRHWCNDRIEQLAGMPCDPRAFPAFFAACVDDWVYRERRLAFAWREGQLLRASSPSGRALQQQWEKLWSDFWHAATARCGLGRGAGVD